jgi:hypothetical protein
MPELAEQRNLFSLRADITSVCHDGLHGLCSTRLCVNPEDGWHNARYQACGCECHQVPPHLAYLYSDDNALD